MTPAIKAVTDTSFVADVLEQDRPVLVDFWAEWCAPCRLLTPVLDSIAQEHSDRILVVKLNVDGAPETVARYSVTSIPTIKVYVDGVVATTIVGVKPKSVLLQELSAYLERRS